MDTPHVYAICVEGHLTERWSTWFEGLAIQNDDPAGQTILTGLLPDQSALYGLLGKIHDLNLVLISVSRLPADE
ncbi:MAG TPA: hypothetical protein VK249_30365 [Anaerolineales bacterium]|nr:hypothetical protein [Anaerolineales bacterium]